MPAKKTKKVDTAIVVAVIGLVGTIIAALLASPIIPKLFDREPTAASNDSQARSERLIFSNDFESGSSSGFAFSSDGYEVVKEKNNQVLQMSGSGSGSLYAFFGPTDFSDGVIVFRLNYRYFDSFLLNFRAELDLHTYTLYFSPDGNEITLGYNSAENDWELQSFENNGVRPFQINDDIWYEIRLEMEGEQMDVWVDGNKILSSVDSRLQEGSMEFAIQANGTVWIDDVEVWQYLYGPQ